MAYEFIRTEAEGPLTIITINRPDRMNALHMPANLELVDAFDRFEHDDSQWVAIITGAGERAFCAGNDLKAQAETGALGLPPNGFGGLTSRFSLNKPVIAAVNGVAMGGGFEIALACDLLIASENAIFALPEVKVGLAALAGGLLNLPRQIGRQAAMGMILTARRVTAAEGLSLGFINEVVPAGEALNAARRWAALICENSPAAVRASKETIRRGLEEPLEKATAEHWDYPAMQALFNSEDFVEGPRAFAEKRPPRWSGGTTG